MNRIVFTCGDINGIGPEIALKALNKISLKNKKTQFILIIPKNVFETTSELVKPKFDYKVTDELESKNHNFDQVLVICYRISKAKLWKTYY